MNRLIAVMNTAERKYEGGANCMAKRPKKIMFIVEAMGGGVFTYIVDLANELVNMTDEHGAAIYDMYVAYGIRKQTPKDYKRYFDKKIHLIKVENFERSINATKDIKAFFEIKKIAREVKPDIIHLHSSKAGALGRVAFNRYKVDGKFVPLFYTPHGYSFLMKNHSAAKRMAYKVIEGGCGKLKCTTISCSKGEHEESLKFNKRAIYVDNGIKVKELEKNLDKIKVEEHPFTVFTLGRICYQKNPEMFNRVAEAMPDVKFLWIGDGDLRDELKSKNIEITGWVVRKIALEKSMTADVFVLTSLWEGLPISLLEAMYMKKPCVVSDVIGNRDVIQSGINGYVCEDVDKFVKAIETVKTGNIEALIRNAYHDIINKYNTTIMAEKYSGIYMNKLPETIRLGGGGCTA